MKMRRHFLNLLLSMGFTLTLSTLYAQNSAEVPEQPEEIRQLPDSFKEEYTGKAYDYVETTSWFTRVQRWLLERMVSMFNIDSTGAANVLGILKIIFYSLIILGVMYLIIRIILNKEIRWIFRKNREKNNTLSFEIAENIQEVDFDSLITEAVSKKDFRAAIRYYYLFLLKKLDQFDVIHFDVQKTTYDYQMEVAGSKYASGFNKAAHYYTYIWYGEFLIDEETYGATSNVYQQLIKEFAK